MFLRKFWRRLLQPPAPVVAKACRQDYELLHTLCTVWPDGPLAQAYLQKPSRVIAPQVAAEVRAAIEASLYANHEIGQDHIALLLRIEASHADQDIEDILEEDEGPV
jgi:hypothetical protein